MKNRKISQGVLALAVGLVGGLAATTVHADGPTLYGQLNVSIDLLDNGDDSGLNLSSNRSRLGVKGDVKIQEGLTGLYQIESELRADSANNFSLASRNTFVGLKGDFGTVRAGRFDTPVKLIGRQVELFANQVGDFRNLARGTASVASSPTAPLVSTRLGDERPHNTIAWTVPDFSGVSTTVQYATNIDDGATGTNDNDLISIGLSYSAGPLFVGAGYEQTGNAAPGQDDPSVLRLAGYYNLGDWRFTALWQTISGPVADSDQDVYGLGVRYRHDAWTYKAQAYQLSADASNSDATLVAVGLEYALAKEISLYADYATVDNDDNSGRVPYREGRGDNLAIAANGETASAFSLGAIYRF